jgi:hypothetical protein
MHPPISKGGALTTSRPTRTINATSPRFLVCDLRYDLQKIFDIRSFLACAAPLTIRECATRLFRSWPLSVAYQAQGGTSEKHVTTQPLPYPTPPRIAIIPEAPVVVI